MTDKPATARSGEAFTTRFAFLMAAIASAVGLGNFWRFPYVVGEEGGAVYLYTYLIVALVIALPLLMAEIAMGRKSGMSAIDGVYSLARAESQSRDWGIVAWTGTLTAFFILTFYVVLSTWMLAYLLAAVRGDLSGSDAVAAAETLARTIGEGEGFSPQKAHVLALLALFLIVLVQVVGRGWKSQLERIAVYAIPALFVLLVILAVTALRTGDGERAIAFLTQPDWSRLSFRTVLTALGQCFFSIGIGISLMMTFGATLNRTTNIPAASVSIIGLDTMISILSALALFPFLFAAGLPENIGPELFFATLPVALEAMPGGPLFAIAFLLLALFAAFTSSVALIEVAVSWLEARQGVTRRGAARGLGVILFMFGAAYVFSPSYFRFVDGVMEGVLLPLGGLLVCVFAGWVLSREMLISELGEGLVMNIWRLTMRWVLPIIIAAVLVFGLADMLDQTPDPTQPVILHAAR